MKQTKYSLRPFLTFLFIIIGLGLIPLCMYASDNPNTITFYNSSGELTQVKLMGPTGQTVEVPHGESRTVNVAAGEYYLLVRYGSKPDIYTYTKGDPFTVTQTKTQYSVITITLHKVVGGNYPAHPISSKEFDNAPLVWRNVDRPEAIKTLTPVLPPPNIQFLPPTINLPPPIIQLPPIHLPPPTIHLPPPAIYLPPPTIHLPFSKETTYNVTKTETLDLEDSTMKKIDSKKSAQTAQAKEPFAIKDKRLLELSGPDPCHTDAKITASSSQGYYMGGIIHVDGGQIHLWCNGAKHTWIGRHENIQGVIALIDSDKENPLQFKIDKEKGYVYQKGKGTVTMSDGKVIKLPISVGVGLKDSITPSRSTTLDLAGEWEGTVNWQGIIFTITFSLTENKREITNLKVIYECAKGVGKIAATLTKPVTILEDNTFNFVAGQGSSGTATFVSEEYAEGSYKAPFSMKCGDDFLKISGKWTAQKKKK